MNNPENNIEITIDSKTIKVPEGTTILQAAEKLGITIPTLCHVENLPHTNSCLLCIVKIPGSNRFLPACSTKATDKMTVESGTEEITELRREALELLIGDHLGDCQAPCRLVHPQWLDLPGMIRLIRDGQFESAAAIAAEHISNNPGSTPGYEKACRRGRIDQTLAIEKLINFAKDYSSDGSPVDKPSERPWTISMGALKEEEKEIYLREAATGPQVDSTTGFTQQEAQAEARRCLHCDCTATGNCRLKDLAIEHDASPSHRKKRTRVYTVDSSHENLVFEPGKCIQCGICVRITEAKTEAGGVGVGVGMAHIGRGFDGMVKPPFDVDMAGAMDAETAVECAEACPTGALMLKV